MTLPAVYDPAEQEQAVEESPTQSLVEALVPYFPDDSNKSRYLSYRACGFTVTESIGYAGITLRTLRRWRAADAEFRRLDTKDIATLRNAVGDSFLEMEYRRNYRLVLQSDFDIISKHLKSKENGGDPLTDKEHQYLLKVRSHYTPQQMEILSKLTSGDEDRESFDWTEMVLSVRGRRGEIHLAAKRDGEGE